MATSTYIKDISSPIGTLRLLASEEALVGCVFPSSAAEEPGSRDDSRPVLDEAARQLREYFAGTRREFDLPLDPSGTEFQLRVWEALRRIPYGQTRSYMDLARELGQPGASRAVGLANARNPISIIVPCHRVIGADGKLTGYAGGIPMKQALLALERGWPLEAGGIAPAESSRKL